MKFRVAVPLGREALVAMFTSPSTEIQPNPQVFQPPVAIFSMLKPKRDEWIDEWKRDWKWMFSPVPRSYFIFPLTFLFRTEMILCFLVDRSFLPRQISRDSPSAASTAYRYFTFEYMKPISLWSFHYLENYVMARRDSEINNFLTKKLKFEP